MHYGLVPLLSITHDITGSSQPLSTRSIPDREYPELALDPNNAQTTCSDCNHGKGDRDQTDWRQPVA